jgi:CRISP-associated protein Cas1
MSTIYITEQDVSFQIQHRYFKVLHQQKQRISVPIRNLSQIIIFGNINLPRDVMKILRSQQIPVLYLTQSGEYLGRLENPSELQPKYSTYQKKRLRDIEFLRATAESIIWAKLHNQQVFLQSWTRHYANGTTQRALNYLTLLMDNLAIAPSVEYLCEYSEEADKVYDSAIASLLNFYNECPHTTTKRISRFFQLGHQLLHQYIYTLLNTTELHPDYAILHRDTHHELPLAWDFTAEFRAPIVDDLVLSFVKNLPNTNGNGKSQPQTLLQRFLQHWEAKLRTFILHPYVGEVSYRQCLNLQVREYLACLLGDVEFYRPLALKFHPTHNHLNPPKPQKAPLTLVK